MAYSCIPDDICIKRARAEQILVTHSVSGSDAKRCLCSENGRARLNNRLLQTTNGELDMSCPTSQNISSGSALLWVTCSKELICWWLVRRESMTNVTKLQNMRWIVVCMGMILFGSLNVGYVRPAQPSDATRPEELSYGRQLVSSQENSLEKGKLWHKMQTTDIEAAF